MAQIFTGIILKPYIGVPYGFPAPFKSNTGWIRYAPLFVDWAAYGASSTNNKIGITQDLKGTVAAQLIPKIVSVYIDNLGSNVPVYVQFPSTGFVIAAPPNSADWYNCITQDLAVNIYGIGFVTGQIPKTNFYFTDAYVPPYSNFEQQNVIDKWLASAVISRGSNIYNQDFGVPALGDQTMQAKMDIRIIASTTLFGTPLPSGYIYLTDIDLRTAITTAPGSGNAGEAVLESTGVAGILFDWNWSIAQAGVQQIYHGQGNLKIDATQLWRLRIVNPNGGGTGFLNFICSYTTNPY